MTEKKADNVEEFFEGDEVEKFFWYAMGIDIRDEPLEEFNNTEEEWLGY